MNDELLEMVEREVLSRPGDSTLWDPASWSATPATRSMLQS